MGVRIGLARVHGRSMEPTLLAGDRLVVAHGLRPRRGGLVVVRLPDGTVAVKRATMHGPDGWWVERDNPAVGVDSWSVGAIPEFHVVARVLWRLPRCGRLVGRDDAPRRRWSHHPLRLPGLRPPPRRQDGDPRDRAPRGS